MSSACSFQLYAATPGAPVRWRLLSGNNHELGRGEIGYPDVDTCRQALLDVPGLLVDADRTVSDSADNRWHWRLSHHGQVLVRSSRSFDRRLRCERARDLFVVAAATAGLRDGLLVTSLRAYRQPVRAAL